MGEQVDDELTAVEEYRFTEMPKNIDFGAVAGCPVCKRTGRQPGTKVADNISCERCNGFGIVPNKGPVVAAK